MKFSLRFNNDLPVQEYLSYAKAAESAGFDQFWVSDDLFLRSAPVILSAVAMATERIEIGTCILNPYTMHPAEIAMFAATLDELSGGRFNLGISSGAEDFIHWLGLEFRHPRTLVVEAIDVINKLTSNENARTSGKVLRWTEEAWLRFESRRRVPIYLGAMSPKMLEEIGAIADGGLPLLFPPEHFANIFPYVEKGLARAGRSTRRHRPGGLHLVFDFGGSRRCRSFPRRQNRLLWPRHEPIDIGATGFDAARLRADSASLS